MWEYWELIVELVRSKYPIVAYVEKGPTNIAGQDPLSFLAEQN
jgi:hypothetical protein